MCDSMVWFQVSCPSGLSVQMICQRPLMGSQPQSVLCVPLTGVRVWDFTLFHSQRIAMCICWWKTWADPYLRVSSGKSWKSWAFMPRESCSSALGATTKTLTSSADLAFYSVTGAEPWGVEGAFSDWTLQPTGHSGDGRLTKMPSAMQVLPMLWPHRAQLWMHAPVCWLWWGLPSGEPQGSSWNSVAVGKTCSQLVGLY